MTSSPLVKALRRSPLTTTSMNNNMIRDNSNHGTSVLNTGINFRTISNPIVLGILVLIAAAAALWTTAVTKGADSGHHHFYGTDNTGPSSSSFVSRGRSFPVPRQPLRLFSASTPTTSYDETLNVGGTNQKDSISHLQYSSTSRAQYMRRYGPSCIPSSASVMLSSPATQASSSESTSTSDSMLYPREALMSRYDSLPTYLQVEVWKYCMLQLRHGNIFVGSEPDEIQFFIDPIELLRSDSSDSDGHGSSALDGTKGGVKSNVAIQMDLSEEQKARVPKNSDTDTEPLVLHSSFLKLGKSKSTVLLSRQMLWMLMDPDVSVEELTSNPLLVEQTLGSLVQAQQQETQGEWTILKATCTTNAVQSCPMSHGGYCCQITAPRSSDATTAVPILALKHPIRGLDLQIRPQHEETLDDIAYPSYASIQVIHLNDEARVTPRMTPNFFDILLQNNCLPTTKACHRCLKKKEGGCAACQTDCPCYCSTLCKIRPPPKQITQIWNVYPPVQRTSTSSPSRLIPKRIHQTYFEEVDKEKYPNMSRLMESWKRQDGWEYFFYSDDEAMDFLSTHFPPEVLEAYKAITPGAFKADLFRYCVLLIQGGIYADMDVLLEASNLDELISEDVGFIVPMDEPGSKVGARSCLWNGLLAVAPGHPVLARTIQLVVNNIRNRFTSVDYDDMLCPNPVLSVSHSVDTLFTCGPCILGSALNDVLGRHMQAEFVVGDVPIWGGATAITEDEDGGTDSSSMFSDPDDPRHFIPGRMVILEQNKNDMGAHRFTWEERNLIVAATDMPDYDDRPKSVEHYSKTHEKVGVYGLKKLYVDSKKANEEFRVVVRGMM